MCTGCSIRPSKLGPMPAGCLTFQCSAQWSKSIIRGDKTLINESTTLRSLINVLSLITVQGVTLVYKKFKVSSDLGLFPFLRP